MLFPILQLRETADDTVFIKREREVCPDSFFWTVVPGFGLAQDHHLTVEAMTPQTAEVYNIGMGTGNSVLEVIDACRQPTGIEIEGKVVERRPGDAPALVASPDKIRSALGWQPVSPEILPIVEIAGRWHRGNRSGHATG